ncbi:ER-golgi trafficking TRAPP I complex 85 kDa subunit-domain-containing protein [Radiomyces spectabilis]|uniref:ER-golgi trafficking TRAPP I complex 85 kDa subunit-domain-containing protein n=1 Tax=Radiomyces spectabilis TaxID=64574 RepID=UPI00221EC4F7|nr:ER-golgi trafficking TRAPP I complex 85 kDa subunit-domain-containing protein [Radiomyces spectabilis]KAI8381466.1 ER-golgi trafficking TRAPP I complex 85 kDa subunit-domain-containing protein [Radiomyces spectabilis]
MVTPWYADFRRLILSYRGIAEHETFDHPVATLIVISSANPDPMGTIMQLYNPNIPSFTVDKPYVDPNILRFYLLLHDPHKTTLEHSQSVFEKMKRTFGLHCHMLTINSRPRPPATDFFDELANNDVMAEDHIRMIWEKELNESQSIETKLQMYADQPNFSHQSQLVPLSPALSGASSDLVRSNATSPSISGLPSNTVHSTDLQVGPLEMNESDEALSSKPSPTEGQLISDADSPAVQYGRYFTDDDIEATRSMVKELVVQSLIPFMERNIQHWNEQVASARRGLTGRLFGASRRFFGTSSRTASPQSMQTIPATGPNVPPGMTTVMIYPYAAPEAQMRKLADYAFMIRDYKFAHAIYDTVRRDYATEKAYKYHAGTQEMIGLCQLIMNQPLASKNDVDRNFELAVQQYLGRCRSPFYATRTTVMYYELLKARRMWREIPTALVRMTGEDSDLRSALFLEQAAHCFLRAPRPLVRKYGFHLVMAGHRYGKAAQRHHAFRCYKMASFILTGDQWSVAKNHVQFALGRQAFHLGHLEEAVSYFADVLADTKQTPQQQLAHVREFLFIYRQYTSQAGIDPLKVSLPHLALPTIFDQMIRINLFNSQSNTETQEEWAAMEMELLEENITSGYIAKSKKALAIEQQDDNRVVCAVGEPAMAHITLYNPLQISIQLSHLVLGCKHRASTQRDTKEEADGTADLDETMPQGTPVTGTDMLSYGDFELQAIPDITLEPLEQRTLHLAIVPRREGSLKVTGLHYTLNDLVHSFRPFHKKGRRLNATKEQRMTPTYAPDRTLDILVTSPMPLLDVAFHQIPETILSGEVVQAVLEINNRGHKGLTALRMKSSHPSFICVGQPDELGKRIYSKSLLFETCHIDNRIYDSSVISIPLPSENDRPGIVGPGHTTLVPLWIRGDRIGKHSFKFLFSYQSEEENTAIAHRTLRYALGVQVLPSLKINAFTRPSTTGTNEFILGIEIENLQTVANFDLTQLTLASPAWTIVPLSINMESKDDIQEKATVPARQTSFAYYKIKRIESVDLAKHSDSPEAWTSNALEALLNNDADRSVAPPPLDLHISKLAFVSFW